MAWASRRTGGLPEPSLAQIDETLGDLAARTGVQGDAHRARHRRPAARSRDVGRRSVAQGDHPCGDEHLSGSACRTSSSSSSHDATPDIFELVLQHRSRFSRVTFWGVTDAQSWLHEFPIPGRINYPLLWDREGRPKPALAAVAEVSRGILDESESDHAEVQGPGTVVRRARRGPARRG